MRKTARSIVIKMLRDFFVTEEDIFILITSLPYDSQRFKHIFLYRNKIADIAIATTIKYNKAKTKYNEISDRWYSEALRDAKSRRSWLDKLEENLLGPSYRISRPMDWDTAQNMQKTLCKLLSHAQKTSQLNALEADYNRAF